MSNDDQGFEKKMRDWSYMKVGQVVLSVWMIAAPVGLGYLVNRNNLSTDLREHGSTLVDINYNLTSLISKIDALERKVAALETTVVELSMTVNTHNDKVDTQIREARKIIDDLVADKNQVGPPDGYPKRGPRP